MTSPVDGHLQSNLQRQSYRGQEGAMYREQEGAMGGQDVGLLAPGPAAYQYDTPYEDDDGPYRDRMMTTSPSIGPWDSASQRSLPHHSQPAFPLPQPSHMPLAGESTQLNGEKHLTDKPSYSGLSYVDEDGEYYQTDKLRPGSAILNGSKAFDTVEMGNVRPYSSYDDDPAKYASYQDHPSYPYPPQQGQEGGFAGFTRPSNLYIMLLFPTGLDRLLSLFNVKTGAYPVEQAIERKKRGLGGQKYPVAAWCLTAAMTAVMVYEMVRNYQAMGTPIAIRPTFNYMIGPSSEVLINIGARFPPCMKNVPALPATFELACLNDTSTSPTTACTIEQICGHGGFHGETPDQWWRFILPIFLHVGIIHLIVNMLVQITASAQVEREMGTVPFLIVYMLGGIYGFVLGGNFTRTGIPSVGASGALFATNACVLVDLVLHWKYEERPKLKAFLLFLEFGIGFAMGYIPNAVDGLAHLGGWAMGILCGTILYPAITETKRRKYVIWGCRVVALALIIMAMVMTIKNFYTDDPNKACEWCKYLSCIPTSSNDHCTGTGITTTGTSTTKRSWDLL
ncbi:rhomboid family membrane protein [Cryptococcus neoformans Tu401-1]|nr:rhomboid family membrane protein [Cryptococcus neoformans var. grubii Tu401-1]